MARDPAADAIDRLVDESDLPLPVKLSIAKGNLEAQLAAANATIAEQSSVLTAAHTVLVDIVKHGSPSPYATPGFDARLARARGVVAMIEGKMR
jgi:hypothetical protein